MMNYGSQQISNMQGIYLDFLKRKKIILFGSYGSNTTINKGFDLLLKSLQTLNNTVDDYELAVFGDASSSILQT